MRKTLIALLAIFIIMGCNRKPKNNVTLIDNSANDTITDTSYVTSFEDSLMVRGLQAILHLQGVFAAHLLHAMRNGNMSEALEYCSSKALSLTDSLSKQSGMKIKRVTHRARNKANQVTSDDLVILNQYLGKLSRDEDPQPTIVTENPVYYSVYAPIVINNPICLECHGIPGVDMLEQDYIAIHLSYPQDSAINFKIGDLRGMWRIDIPKGVLLP